VDYERVMVCAAHPDDELLMAGTIAKLADRGVRVVVLQMTDGCEGYPSPDMRDTIVALRRGEADAANAVLGIARRIHLGRPDMGLVNDKATLRECIQAIREERPDAIFALGPDDRHRDHVASHHLAVEARWHAGEPVAAELGEVWMTPHLYLYNNVTGSLPTVEVDVTGYAHKHYEALATQESQMVLFETHWGYNRERFLAEAARLKEAREPAKEAFWLHSRVALKGLLPRGL
jgi:LmbE family N-acetylglucosaminyl deacetylase